MPRAHTRTHTHTHAHTRTHTHTHAHARTHAHTLAFLSFLFFGSPFPHCTVWLPPLCDRSTGHDAVFQHHGGAAAPHHAAVLPQAHLQPAHGCHPSPQRFHGLSTLVCFVLCACVCVRVCVCVCLCQSVRCNDSLFPLCQQRGTACLSAFFIPQMGSSGQVAVNLHDGISFLRPDAEVTAMATVRLGCRLCQCHMPFVLIFLLPGPLNFFVFVLGFCLHCLPLCRAQQPIVLCSLGDVQTLEVSRGSATPLYEGDDASRTDLLKRASDFPALMLAQMYTFQCRHTGAWW